MSKLHPCLLSFLLILSFFVPGFILAEDLVGIKNLSWEEQKNRTKIVLETTQPLVYTVSSPQSTSEIQLELANLDLRNMPQELFINTSEVVSLRTFPQTEGQKAKIIVKLSSILPYEVNTDGANLYVMVNSKGSGDGLLAPAPEMTSQPAPAAQQESVKQEPVQEAVPAPIDQKLAEEPKAMPQETETPAPADEVKELKTVSPATEVRDVRIEEMDNRVDVVLVGNGSFTYDVFELSNPNRIVVDLKSVSVAPGVKNVQASNEMLSRVRVAQYQTSPKVARAVIDLNSKVPYSVTLKGSELLIHIGTNLSNDATLNEEPAVTASADTVTEPEPSESLPKAEETSSEPTQLESAPVQSEPAPVEIAPAQPVQMEPVKMAAKDPVPSLESAPKNEEPITQDNEKFFTFKPDTSLFAQEGGSTGGSGTGTGTTSTGSSTGEGAGGYGMGSFGDKTLRSGEKQYTGEPFSFDFKDIDIKDLFRFIADISGLNVILDPAVRGSVTLKLTEVPWDQALDLITKNQGLGYTIEGNVIRIAPIQKIADEEKKRADAERQQMLSAPLVTKIKPLSYAKATDVDRVVRRLLTPKGSSIIDSRTNQIIITDINTNIDAIINLIDTLDTRTPQVLIESRIVETNKNFSQAFGIQWGFRGIVDPTFGNNTTLQFPNNVLVSGNVLTPTSGITGNPLGGYAVNLPTDQAPNSAIGLSLGNILDTFRLDLALMALEQNGNARILSSPKVATQNNQKAEILQGAQIPYQTIANNTITTTFVNAALRMSVTPQITAEGTIIMEIEVENNRPDFSRSVGAAGGTPPINIERATTTLLVEDGGTTVIGGIFQAQEQYTQGRTPILHRIPLLGWLFKNTNVVRENRELLIFITPRILR
ncbi:MAG TPA: type IV pilus secretin PilQ [Acidobacteriota bacterium]|nr:type IV pilus secretin PilQ [Acidobacteriota bacterium]